MSLSRYPQFCPFARAAEILGPRWTILILRNLGGMGPQRFSDLKAGLQGVSTSTLSQRLDELGRQGIVRQRSLPPPAATTVYELTEAGRALAPVLSELARFGARFLDPPEPGDQIEASWARAALVLFKGWEATPDVSLELRIQGGDEDVVVAVRGGNDGTHVENLASEPAQASLRLAPDTLLSLLLGHYTLDDARASGRLEIEGDAAAAARLPDLFELDRRRLGLPSDAPDPPSR